MYVHIKTSEPVDAWQWKNDGGEMPEWLIDATKPAFTEPGSIWFQANHHESARALVRCENGAIATVNPGDWFVSWEMTSGGGNVRREVNFVRTGVFELEYEFIDDHEHALNEAIREGAAAADLGQADLLHGETGGPGGGHDVTGTNAAPPAPSTPAETAPPIASEHARLDETGPTRVS